MNYGYARVSTSDQDTRLQREALLKAGVEDVREETGSAIKKRPVLADVYGVSVACMRDGIHKVEGRGRWAAKQRKMGIHHAAKPHSSSLQ